MEEYNVEACKYCKYQGIDKRANNLDYITKKIY